MLGYLPQHIAELWAVAFGVLFALVGVITIFRADSALIYRDGIRLFSTSERSPGPLARPVSSAALRWIGGITVAVGLFIAVFLSRPQTGCPVCIEDPWGSAGWVIGTLVLWGFIAIAVGARIRHLFYNA